MTKEEFLKTIKGKMIISCQAVKGEPLYVEEKSIMYLMARAAKQAGAECIRTSSVRDVIAIKKETGLPVIGLIKRQYEGFDSYITTTMREVDELVEAKSDVIAIDCCFSKRGDGKDISTFMKEVRAKYPNQILKKLKMLKTLALISFLLLCLVILNILLIKIRQNQTTNYWKSV